MPDRCVVSPAVCSGCSDPGAFCRSGSSSCSDPGTFCGSSSSSCSVLWPWQQQVFSSKSARSVRWLQRPGQEQSQRQQALARPVAAARGRCRGWNSGGCSDLWRLLQRPAACVIAASSSLVGASCGSSSTCCTVQRPCRSVPWLQQHLLQPCRSVLWLQQHLLRRPAALQERPVPPAVPVAVQQPCWSVLWLWQHLLQCPGAFWRWIRDVEQVPGSFRGKICDVE